MGDLSPGRHLTTSGDIFGCQNWAVGHVATGM